MLENKTINMDLITGTMVWYYHICHREVWLLAHGLEADQSNELLEIGRIINENSYNRSIKEVSIGNIVVDLISQEGGKVVVGEVKKSSTFEKSATMQLAYYLLTLEERGLDAVGYLHFPKEKKKIKVELTPEVREELRACFLGISQIVDLELPPVATVNKYCAKCAYQEFCWA